VKCEKCGGEYVLVQKKMMRREAWVNVYCAGGECYCKYSYKSEEEAIKHMRQECGKYIKTILLHDWYEEEK